MIDQPANNIDFVIFNFINNIIRFGSKVDNFFLIETFHKMIRMEMDLNNISNKIIIKY